MKNYQKSRKNSAVITGFLFVTLLILVSSCRKEEYEPIQGNYLVSYRLNHSFTLETVQSILSLAAFEYPEAITLVENADYGVRIYIISYQTYYLDSLINASGLVCMPDADEEFPVISFQNGTNTDDDNAPTKNPFNESYILLEMMASNGYIVLIPDYIGFGASEDLIHPYYHRSSTNNAVIDMIHAFNEMKLRDDILATSTAATYLMGYSQGGWATLSALDEIENGTGTEIDVAAASCGAGAYDLTAMSNYILNLETFPGPHYLPYFIYSQQELGLIQEPLSTFFKSPYAERIPQLFDGTNSNNEVNAQLTNTIGDLLTDNLINNFQTSQDYEGLRLRLEENSIDAWNTNAELHLYHGTDDLNVPAEQSSLIYNAFINAGADPDKVLLFELTGKDHEGGVLPWGISTINWFNTLEGK